jgi:hypothetical protein
MGERAITPELDISTQSFRLFTAQLQAFSLGKEQK